MPQVRREIVAGFGFTRSVLAVSGVGVSAGPDAHGRALVESRGLESRRSSPSGLYADRWHG